MKNFETYLFKLKNRIVEDKQFAKDVYNALCNTRWRKIGNSGNVYSCSSRYAGGLIATMRGNTGQMNHLDFYYSGREGTVSEEVEKTFRALGWVIYPWEHK